MPIVKKCMTKGVFFSFLCMGPSALIALSIALGLKESGRLCEAVNGYDDVRIVGILAFLGIACGFAYKSRVGQFFGSGSFLCGAVFGLSHFILQIYPDRSCESIDSFIVFEEFVFMVSLMCVFSCVAFALMAHDGVIKRFGMSVGGIKTEHVKFTGSRFRRHRR